jgi:predicted DNA-binding transcriptional regulator YafY
MEMLKRMHKLIDASHTGTPIEFSKRLGVSDRYLRGIIDEMKDMGAPIKYSRRDTTYYYSKPFVFEISCSFRHLSPEEQENISAGIHFSKNFSFTACFVP